MSVPGTESMKLGQRSLSATNGISTIRLETQPDGTCYTSEGIFAKTSW